MLRDHGRLQERWARRRRERSALPEAYGEFIVSLAAWDWFCTITFRNEVTDSARAVAEVKAWLDLVRREAGLNFAYLIAEELGALGGRFHCHILVADVRFLNRGFWWKEAYRRFGRSRIEPCERARAASFYAAKYSAKELGEFHFGGGLEAHRIARFGDSFRLVGATELKATQGCEVVPSASLPGDFFRLGSR